MMGKHTSLLKYKDWQCQDAYRYSILHHVVTLPEGVPDLLHLTSSDRGSIRQAHPMCFSIICTGCRQHITSTQTLADVPYTPWSLL